MKKEYDFSKAEKGRFHRPRQQLQIPIYLDRDVANRLRRNRVGPLQNMSQLVNGILRKELDLLEMLGD